eukprot:Gregarina_sp_Poly_1__1699@NODE_1437_length_4150_cov_131_837864_g953_i0_p2_GENE_NODE_1437_length_4150_cov_131_837864_g953_i0NODE_1437_length_4150_cov_131_837864_g953_i0_p2_ORF_typecomplete_len600_score74_60IPK/PF03770_16/4_1e31_NODE_1437_length_4150_cov_131_837864_g953_i021233922
MTENECVTKALWTEGDTFQSALCDACNQPLPQLLCTAPIMLEGSPKKLFYPIKISNPRLYARIVDRYFKNGFLTAAHTLLMITFDSVAAETDLKPAVAKIRLTVELVLPNRRNPKLLEFTLPTAQTLAGDMQSVFMHLMIPLVSKYAPDLIVAIILLRKHGNPIISHVLQWLDAQLIVMSEMFASKRYLSVILFSGSFPSYLNLDSTAVYPSLGDPVVAFPECERWVQTRGTWTRRPVCSTTTMEQIRTLRLKLGFGIEEADAGLLSASSRQIPSLTDLFRSARDAVQIPAGASPQRASWELSGGFSPLGGHFMSWVYSPSQIGTTRIVKKTSHTEGAFYALTGHYLWASDFPISSGLLREMPCEQWLSANPEGVLAQLQPLADFLPHVFSIDYEQGKCFVEMINLLNSNICDSDRRPAHCAMDLKIGTRLWGLDADEGKRKRMEEKAKSTTAGTTGLCIIAYRTTSPESGRILADVSRECTKTILSEEALKDNLKIFFALASRKTLKFIYEKVRKLQDWFLSQTVVHFHSSSLFIVYDSRATEENMHLKLIDFAHASFFHSTVDESSLLGLARLRLHLEELLASHCDECSPFEAGTRT